MKTYDDSFVIYDDPTVTYDGLAWLEPILKPMSAVKKFETANEAKEFKVNSSSRRKYNIINVEKE